MKRKIIGMLLLIMLSFGGCKMIEAEPIMGVDFTEEYIPVESREESQPAQEDKEAHIDYIIDSYEPLHSFASELFGRNIDETNPVLSPVSAYLALALAGKGAEGETKEAFQAVIKDLEAIPHDLMVNIPREKEDIQVLLANSAWVDEHLILDAEWVNWADSIYKSEVFQTELAREDAIDDMNSWIDEKTNGLIPVLYEEPLSEETRLVLLNTIYFNGDWAIEFEAKSTRIEDFHLEDGSVNEVEMMNMNDKHLLYVNENNMEGIILPYRDDSIIFMALKPVDNSSVREMYEKITWGQIKTMINTKETTLCNLKLPKFQVEFEKRLNESLKDMGLEIAFIEDEADFSGIGTLDDGSNMYIETVQQKAVVIVDEEGTEAAAVTSVEMNRVTGAMNQKIPINVYFDEPFVYMILDKERNVPLFMGIMDNPKA